MCYEIAEKYTYNKGHKDWCLFVMCSLFCIQSAFIAFRLGMNVKFSISIANAPAKLFHPNAHHPPLTASVSEKKSACDKEGLGTGKRSEKGWENEGIKVINWGGSR